MPSKFHDRLVRTLLCAAIGLSLPVALQAQERAIGETERNLPSGVQQQSPARLGSVTSQDSAPSAFTLDPDVLRGARIGDTLRIRWPDWGDVDFSVSGKRALEDGRQLINGRIGSATWPPAEATIIVNGRDMTGTIRTSDGKVYRVRPVGNGVNALELLDPEAMPEEHPRIDRRAPGKGESADGGSNPMPSKTAIPKSTAACLPS